jgi:hypothetical protein
MKIGIIVSYFDFRADVRSLIKEFNDAGHQVVIFYRAAEKKEIESNVIGGTEYRLIADENRNLRNRLLEYAFLIFKKLPLSRHNYFLIELFKISNFPSAKARFFHRLILGIQRLGLNFISYDFLLRNLRYSASTVIDDIDQFIGITEFQSDYFASRLLKEKRPLSIYVYSWDHPCKHTRFSRYFKYKVWSEGIRQDLIALQGIPAENIQVCGSSQFSFIFDFLQSGGLDEKRPFDFPYVYYCCAIGIIELIPQETAIMLSLAEELEKCRPEWKLVVRPYPLLKNWSLYEPLFSKKNVVFDDGFRHKPFPDFTSASFDKFRKLKAAELVLHSGSTIGLEACLLDVPSLLVDFGYGKERSGLSVYGFIHQFQNRKYLLDEGLGLKRPADLSVVLSEPGPVKEKNKQLAAAFPLTSLREISRRLLM